MYSLQATRSKPLILPTSHTAGHTNVGWIDTRGADELKIDVVVSNIATVGTASATGGSISIGEASDTNVSNATTIVANRTGLKYGRLITYNVDTRLMARYAHATFTAGTAGVSNETQLVAVVGTLGRLSAAPTSTGGMVDTVNTDNVALIVTG